MDVIAAWLRDVGFQQESSCACTNLDLRFSASTEYSFVIAILVQDRWDRYDVRLGPRTAAAAIRCGVLKVSLAQLSEARRLRSTLVPVAPSPLSDSCTLDGAEWEDASERLRTALAAALELEEDRPHCFTAPSTFFCHAMMRTLDDDRQKAVAAAFGNHG